MNVLTYSAEKERLRHDLRSARSIMFVCVKNRRYTAAKEACDMMRHIIRQLELLDIQQERET